MYILLYKVCILHILCRPIIIVLIKIRSLQRYQSVLLRLSARCKMGQFRELHCIQTQSWALDTWGLGRKSTSAMALVALDSLDSPSLTVPPSVKYTPFCGIGIITYIPWPGEATFSKSIFPSLANIFPRFFCTFLGYLLDTPLNHF